MAVKDGVAKVSAAKDALDVKKRQADIARGKYQAAKEKAEAAKKFQETKDLEYLRGKNGFSDKILAAKDKANQASSSVEQRQMELGQAQSLVKQIIEKIEKMGGGR
ncbi:hypothetical protein [Methanocella sp. MCL-LM]|uniref:hypothetical protein n=1 Tax=Methanocella sp. MCL-LM TaxID=3412035 RepID=UPI003C70B6FB